MSTPASPLHADVQDAITKAEDDLAVYGDGQSWTVEIVMSHLAKALAKHIPGFDHKDFVYTEEG